MNALWLSLLFSALWSTTIWADEHLGKLSDQKTKPTASWRLPARYLPPPLAASPILYQQIANTPQPVAGTYSVSEVLNRAKWEALVAKRKRASDALNFADLESKFNVSIATLSIADVKVFEVLPKLVKKELDQARLLYLHGGAYVFNSGPRGAYEAIIIASYTGIPVWSVDYRTALDAPSPAALQDALKVYTALATHSKIKAIALGGTSAGAGLSLALMQELNKLNITLPKAIYAGSPWADLTKTSDTLYSLEGVDRLLARYDGLLSQAAELYAGTYSLDHPSVSPLYGSFESFPPTYLVSGTRDLLLSDTVRVHRAIKNAGGYAELNVYEGMSHAEYLVNLSTEESQHVYRELGAFLKPLLTNTDGLQ